MRCISCNTNKHENCGGCTDCRDVMCRFCGVQISSNNWIGNAWIEVAWEDNDKNIVNACKNCFPTEECYICENDYGGYQCIYCFKSLCFDCSVSNMSGEYMCPSRNQECKAYRTISRFMIRMIVKRRTVREIQRKIKDDVIKSTKQLTERNMVHIINSYLF